MDDCHDIMDNTQQGTNDTLPSLHRPYEFRIFLYIYTQKKKMRKLIISMHTSLDGFVAGPGGEMDWIHIDEEIFDYAGNMTDQADAALYGRKTWEMMDSYWPTAADSPTASKHDKEHSAWYKNVQKLVVSKTMQGQKIDNLRIIHEDIPGAIRAEKEKPGKNIQVFGSPAVVHILTQHNLIDEYWLFINPVLLGQGIPLFTKLEERQKLSLLESRAFTSGVMGLHYRAE